MEQLSTKPRILNKQQKPTQEIINNFIGTKHIQMLTQLENMLKQHYELNRKLKFPFGNSYGWSYRYTHKTTLLFYLFFEKNGFLCTVSINDKGAETINKTINTMIPKTQNLWQTRYPCGKIGGWVNYSIETEEELNDILKLIACKVKPKK